MERSVTHVALFAALIAVLGLVPRIDLAAGVPITAQSLGIMLCARFLGPDGVRWRCCCFWLWWLPVCRCFREGAGALAFRLPPLWQAG